MFTSTMKATNTTNYNDKRPRRQRVTLRDGRNLAYYIIDQRCNGTPSGTMQLSSQSSSSSSSRESQSVPSNGSRLTTPNQQSQDQPQSPHYIFAFHAMFMTGTAFMVPPPSSSLPRRSSSSSLSSSSAISTAPYVTTKENGPSFSSTNPNGTEDNERIECEQTDSSNYVVVSVDRPGYAGSSSVNVGMYSYQDFADDIEQLADHLGVDTFSVVGHSSGGPCALSCAYFMPTRVSSVVILAGDPEYKFQYKIKDSDCGSNDKNVTTTDETSVSTATSSTAIPSTGPLFNFCMGTLLPALMWPITPIYKVSNGLRNDFTIERQPYPFRTEDIHQPTICVLGQNDTLLKRDVAIWVHKRLSNSTLVELPGEGHMDLIKSDVLHSMFKQCVLLSSNR